jgi:hypothetical protein
VKKAIVSGHYFSQLKKMFNLQKFSHLKKNSYRKFVICQQIVVEQCNRPDDLMKEAETDFGLKSMIVMQRRSGREFLKVLKLWTI